MGPWKRHRFFTLLLCVAGLGATGYGMVYGDNAVFIVGIALVIAGYLLIRKKLKESVKSSREMPPH